MNHEHTIPETRTKEGTAKRNVTRRHGSASKSHQGGRRKGGDSLIDDGSLDYVSVLDEHDPNYDPEEDRSRNYGSTRRPKVSLAEFKQEIRNLILELFESSTVADVLEGVDALNCPEYHFELVKRSISMSMDRNESEREKVSQLISFCYAEGLLTMQQVSKGIERLLEIADELEIDVPGAKEMIAMFIARATVDEVLPPAFSSDSWVSSLNQDVMEVVHRHLNREHASARIEKIWGPGDGRSTDELKRLMDQLADEYLVSRDVEEAVRCVAEMRVPGYHHELVKRAIVVSLDKSEADQCAISDFFTELFQREVVSQYQFTLGFNRLYDLIDDLALDTPQAPSFLAQFAFRASSDGILPASFRRTQDQEEEGDEEEGA
jgi:programmed cell death protein 4